MYFTTAIAFVAGASVAIGITFLFLGARRTSQRRVDLLFGGFSIAYASAITSARASYLADDLSRYAAWARWSTLFAAAGFTLFAWYIASYTDVRPRFVLEGITVAFSVIGVAAIAFPGMVVDVSGGVETFTLPWGESILMRETNEPALFPLFLAALLAVVVFAIAADVVQFRRGNRTDAILLAVGTSWFVFTLVQENLAATGMFGGVFLSDFGFIGFVVTMGAATANRAIRVEEELDDYRRNLASMVEQRTAALEAAQEQLVLQAELQAVGAERDRLSRDLHDVVTQLLFSINLIAASLPRLWRNDPELAERSTSELQRLTRGALAEMRTLLRELRPQAIPDTDLGLLVTQLTQGLAARHDIPAEIDTNVGGVLPPDVHVTIYRIAQEAITNVAKHANANRLVVDLVSAPDQAHLSVEDDGSGFDVDAVPSGHMGIEIMKERARNVGARLTVVSSAGRGTVVEVEWEASGHG